MSARTIANLATDICAIVSGVRRVDGTTIRLMEMGLVPGTEITVTRHAPLGDPIELTVRGTRLCLRRSDADCFLVDSDRVEPPSGQR
jgi:Fe2+ transport system protein FeoA